MPARKVWTYIPRPIKLRPEEKGTFLKEAKEFIAKSQKIAKGFRKIKFHGGRIYIYHLYEYSLWNDPNVKFIKPLIDGRYIEVIFARITIYDKKGLKCTADWQRHNEQWITLSEGTLNECLQFIEADDRF